VNLPILLVKGMGLCSVVTDLGLSPADWSDCLKGCEYIRRLFVYNVYAAFASDH